MPGLGCTSDANLRAFLLGDLPERVAGSIASHLELCPECEAAARRLDELTDPLIDRLRREFDPAAEIGTMATLEGQENVAPERTETVGSPRRVEAYEILEELGRGGTSVVYRARQSHPARVVALKVLLAGPHADAERRARFLAEADTVARLRHPNIVQIHQVGESDGLPFLALEYVDGGSLAQRLGGTPWPPDQAAGLIEQLARAVESAHRAGVVHRDLKPANVLLAADGIPKITDFGLAKLEESNLTATGAVLGTPSYMAPEQAEGKAHDVGPAADVYALGAILYELLTGRPPFRGATPIDTLEQVRFQDPVPPGRLQGRMPLDLDTVCLKCLQKEPSARYPSAEALADDLRRFLQGEPVLARPVGPATRLARWCRRQPKLATAIGLTAASLVLATGLSIALAWSQYRAAARLSAEQALTLAEKTRAEENFRDAQQAVEDYLTRVSNDTLLKQQDSGEFRQLRKNLLEDALKYYQRFLARQGNDPKVLVDLAHAHSTIAGIIGEIGSMAESVSAYQQAVSIWERIVRETPTDSHARNELAACLYNLADRKAAIGLHDESLHAFEQALAILVPLARANPTDSYTRRLLGVTLTYYGFEQERTNQTAAALRSFREAVPILEAQVRANPNDAQPQRKLTLGYVGRPIVAQWQKDLASGYQGLGVIQQSAGQPAESLRSLEKARTLWRALVRDYPTIISYHVWLAVNLSKVGLLLGEMGQPTAALRSHQEALAIMDTRFRHLSGDTNVKAERADTINWIAALQHELGRTAEAIRSYEQARDVIKELVRDHPQVVRYRMALDIGDTGLAALYRDAGRWREALELLDEALKVLKGLPLEWPTYHYHMAACLALRIPLATASRTPLEVEDARRYGDRAMVSLRRAVGRGSNTLAAYRNDPNLNPLREREDFRALLMDLAFPTDPIAR